MPAMLLPAVATALRTVVTASDTVVTASDTVAMALSTMEMPPDGRSRDAGSRQACTDAKNHRIAVCTVCRIPRPPRPTGSDDCIHASGEREQLRMVSTAVLSTSS